MDLRTAYWTSLEEEHDNPEQMDEMLNEIRLNIAKKKCVDDLRLKAIEDRYLRDPFDRWPDNVSLDMLLESAAPRVRILRHLDGSSPGELEKTYERLLMEELTQ